MLLDSEHLRPVLIASILFFNLMESVGVLLLLKSLFVTQQKVDLRGAALLPSAAAELKRFFYEASRIQYSCLQEIKSTRTLTKPAWAIG